MEASLTRLLNLAQQGDRPAENQAFHLAMGRLRSLARTLIGHERRDHTWQATDLVSEAFMQKLRRLQTPIQNRDDFFSIAAYAMRQVLIDHARAKSAHKRVPPHAVADLIATSANPSMDPAMRLAVIQSLERLECLDRGAALSVRCCYMESLTLREAASRMGRPVWKVRVDCEFGLKWMADCLRSL